MLEMTLILILVVVAMVAIIVNRKSLLACIVITVVAALLGLGFLLLYANVDKFGSHDKLIRFTITSSVAVIIALLTVTYIGVKMHFKNFKKIGKTEKVPVQPVGEPRLIPGTNVMAKAVGIFGRQPIERADKPAATVAVESAVGVKTAPVAAAARPVAVAAEKPASVKVAAPVAAADRSSVTPAPTVVPMPATKPAVAVEAPAKAVPSADAMLRRMLDKGVAFKAAGQYVLAEQMYVTYIARCTDNIQRADGELLMLECRIEAGNYEGSKQQLADLLNKLRSGEYALTQEQKKKLAECKISLMKLQQESK